MDAGLDLLGLQHACAAAVAVDEAVAGAAVAMRKGNPPLKDVGVVTGIFVRRFRPWKVEKVAKAADEELVVGPLRAGHSPPAFDEPIYRVLVFHGSKSYGRNSHWLQAAYSYSQFIYWMRANETFAH